MLTIDLYTELTCPWCIIGMHRLDKVLSERAAGEAVTIRHHPVMLMRGLPQEGRALAGLLLERYGITDPRQAFARPEAEARASGLELDLMRQPMAYPTIAAHTLLRLAEPRGTQHALAVAISHAYFLEAHNIADPQVLADIAAAHGFTHHEAARLAVDPAEQALTDRAAEEVAAQGVRSVPHFVFNNAAVLNGGRSEDELAAAIDRAISEARAEA
ncbi:putative DsbA family dithiol-disulfide isomerase [Rhizobium sp. SLBN-94]|nr:putative DsbA family dithiol-disulfide isomerase [Rhizobium sp. SLBN-94]